MKIKCTIEYSESENDYGGTTPTTIATCPRCQHSEESFGQHEESERRSLVMLKENCPRNESNFYVAE